MNTDDEIQLSDDLRHIVAGVRFEADLHTIERRGRGARRRAMAVRGVAGISAVALAAGGAYLGLHHSGTTSPAAGVTHQPAVSTNSGASKVETAAYVVQQTQAALADANDFLIRDDSVPTTGDKYTNWTDPRTGNSYLIEGGGASESEAWFSTYAVDGVLHSKQTEADHDTGTWFVLVQSAGGPMEGGMPTGPHGGPGGTATQIKKWLDSGVFEITGHGESNGHQVTKLRRPWAAGYLEVWVDSRSFQPVHVIMADFANMANSPLKDDQVVTDESWLPRSADMVSLTDNPRIPAGFRQVPPPK